MADVKTKAAAFIAAARQNKAAFSCQSIEKHEKEEHCPWKGVGWKMSWSCFCCVPVGLSPGLSLMPASERLAGGLVALSACCTCHASVCVCGLLVSHLHVIPYSPACGPLSPHEHTQYNFSSAAVPAALNSLKASCKGRQNMVAMVASQKPRKFLCFTLL